MKFLTISCLVLVVCAVSVSTQDSTVQLDEYVKICKKENKVTDKNWGKLLAGAIPADQVTEDLKCTLKCFFEKGNFLDEAGEFLPDNFKASFSHVKDINDIVDKCKALTDAKPCEKAFLISTCLVENKLLATE